MKCPSCFDGAYDSIRCHRCGYEPGKLYVGIALPLGTRLKNGEYQIGKVLGKPGGFGITYLGWNVQLETKVAIKEYLPLQIAGRGAGTAAVSVHTEENSEVFEYGLKSFLEEARTLAQLRHDSIVRVQNFFRENGTAYMVMEYLEGQSLEEYLAKIGRVTAPDAVALFLPVLDGLAYMHQKNILHRDIKPANIYLTEEGKAILLDFGAARQAVQEKSQSMTAILTPGYAPWEQYHRKGKQGPWTDVYACSATLYRMITGQNPSDGPERMIEDELVPVAALVPGVDAGVAAAIEAGLAVKIEERPQTAIALAKLLQKDAQQKQPLPNTEAMSLVSRQEAPPPRNGVRKQLDQLLKQSVTDTGSDIETLGPGRGARTVRKGAIAMLLLLLGLVGWQLSVNWSEIGGHGNNKVALVKTVVPVKWVANSVWPQTNHHSVGLNEFAIKVKEATNGKVEITVKTSGVLGYKGPELLKMVRDGLVPMSDILTNGVSGDEPLFGIVTLPCLIQSFEEGKILNDIARPYFDKVAEQKWGQKILYIAPWPAAGLWTQKEIKSVADMRGLKTRAYDKNGGLALQAVGATPYPLPFSEVYSSLATGVIDSILTSTQTAVDSKLWEVIKFYSPINIIMATNLVTVNLKEFSKLDKETQAVLIKQGKEMEETMWMKVAQFDQQQEAISNKNGIKTVPPSKDFLNELSLITKEIREEWLNTAPPEAKTIVEEFNKKVGRNAEVLRR